MLSIGRIFMNWDWEKLRENQQKYEQRQGGGPGMPKPPQMDDLMNRFKGFKFPGMFLIGILLLALYLGSSYFFYRGTAMKWV